MLDKLTKKRSGDVGNLLYTANPYSRGVKYSKLPSHDFDHRTLSRRCLTCSKTHSQCESANQKTTKSLVRIGDREMRSLCVE